MPRRAPTRVGVAALLALWAVLPLGCAKDESPAAVSPASTSTSTAPSPEGSAAADRTAAVVAAVVHRIRTDNSFSGEVAFDSVSIVDHYGPAPGLISDGSGVSGPPVEESVRAAIEAALAPQKVTWVPELEAPTESVAGSSTSYSGPYAVVAVAEPVLTGDRAEVTSELLCGNMCAIRSTHVVARAADGSWVVDGTTGPIAIS